MKVLLDTMALSEPLRKRPNRGFMTRLNSLSAGDLFTSSVCVMEIRYGCALQDNVALWERIRKSVLDSVNVLAFGPLEAARCGELLAHLAKKGVSIGIEDTQIGATAMAHGLTIVTANLRHFTRIPNLPVENWLE